MFNSGSREEPQGPLSDRCADGEAPLQEADCLSHVPGWPRQHPRDRRGPPGGHSSVLGLHRSDYQPSADQSGGQHGHFETQLSLSHVRRTRQALCSRYIIFDPVPASLISLNVSRQVCVSCPARHGQVWPAPGSLAVGLLRPPVGGFPSGDAPGPVPQRQQA